MNTPTRAEALKFANDLIETRNELERLRITCEDQQQHITQLTKQNDMLSAERTILEGRLEAALVRMGEYRATLEMIGASLHSQMSKIKRTADAVKPRDLDALEQRLSGSDRDELAPSFLTAR